MFTRDELIEAADTQPVGSELPPHFSGAAIDSRMVQPGELFVALRGQATDGHRFIGSAVRAGASAILCAEQNEEATALGVPQVIVSDPLATLHRLAQRHLMRQPHTRVISITGSNGKTSTKDATALLLGRLAPTLKTEGNLNTETGVPVTLLRLKPEHQFAVIEMGAQWVGEIEALCKIAPPDITIVTVVGPEHLEFFGSMEGVIQAEGEAVEALRADGVAVLNDDDPAVHEMAKRTPARVVTYGHRPGAMVRAEDVAGDVLRGQRFTLAHGERRAPVNLHMPGRHAVTTALAAAAVALTCGLDIGTAASSLSEIRPAKRRGEIKMAIGGATLVDDTYNANRQSAEAALDLLRRAAVENDGKRWFVFGDMLELGTYSRDEHAAVGRAAASAVDELVLVGADVAATAEAALAAGMAPERVHLYAASLDDKPRLAEARLAAASFVRERLSPHDVILVKGSLGVGMDAVVAELLETAT